MLTKQTQNFHRGLFGMKSEYTYRITELPFAIHMNLMDNYFPVAHRNGSAYIANCSDYAASTGPNREILVISWVKLREFQVWDRCRFWKINLFLDTWTWTNDILYIVYGVFIICTCNYILYIEYRI